MAIQQLLITKLDDEQIENLKSIMKANDLNKPALLKEAYRFFVSQLSKTKTYTPKYDDFDRVRFRFFNIYVMDDFSQEFNQLALDIGIYKFQLLREVLLTYLIINKSK